MRPAMPAVERFGRRITALLDTPLATAARGGLTPADGVAWTGRRRVLGDRSRPASRLKNST
jgi:hypothetical protein